MPRTDAEPDARKSRSDFRLEILQEISLALNSTLEPQRLLELILDSSIRYTGATTGSVILLTEDGRLDIVASRGLGANVKEECSLALGEGITGLVALHGEALNVPDVTLDSRYVMVKEHIRSELAVPMQLDKRVIGVISVDSTRPAKFDEDDLQLLTIVATQAAQILQNAQSFDELQRRNEQDEILLEIGQALGSSLDLKALFNEVSEILARRCGLARCFLVLVDSATDEIAMTLARGMTAEEVARGRYGRGEGIIGRVVAKAEPIGVRNLRAEPRFLDRTGAFRLGDGEVSFFAVPVVLGEEVVGVFGGAKRFPGDEAFEREFSLFQIVGSTLAQAVKIYREAARERDLLLEENRQLRRELDTHQRFGNIVGTSERMQRVFHTIMSVAPTRSTVLVRGESGTGKELIAHAIHYNSPRAERPFVRVNCAAIPEHLLEAELFGHVKGAFTGAVGDRKGRFVVADGGTIFLDEIGDMSPLLQAKMLRVLQEREVDAVGADLPLKVDVRVIAATHRNLEALVREGEFREDLYYRLHVVPIDVPPLRERPEDIRVLAQHFLEKLRAENDSLPDKISKDALRELVSYAWPGNVRELENVIERAAILAAGKVIRASDLPPLVNGMPGSPGIHPRLQAEGASATSSRAFVGVSENEGGLDAAVLQEFEVLLGTMGGGDLWSRILKRVERTLLERALEEVRGVRLRAAELLGIHRNTFRKKGEEHGL